MVNPHLSWSHHGVTHLPMHNISYSNMNMIHDNGIMIMNRVTVRAERSGHVTCTFARVELNRTAKALFE